MGRLFSFPLLTPVRFLWSGGKAALGFIRGSLDTKFFILCAKRKIELLDDENASAIRRFADGPALIPEVPPRRAGCETCPTQGKALIIARYRQKILYYASIL
jgi:hypothetical protein